VPFGLFVVSFSGLIYALFNHFTEAKADTFRRTNMNQNDNNQTDKGQPKIGQQAELSDLEPKADVQGGGDKLPSPSLPISSPKPPRK